MEWIHSMIRVDFKGTNDAELRKVLLKLNFYPQELQLIDLIGLLFLVKFEIILVYTHGAFPNDLTNRIFEFGLFEGENFSFLCKDKQSFSHIVNFRLLAFVAFLDLFQFELLQHACFDQTIEAKPNVNFFLCWFGEVKSWFLANFALSFCDWVDFL